MALKNYNYLVPLLFLYVVSYLAKPLLPIDETRYMTVAWEMFLQKKYFALSLNFQPYGHKPPFLFWMINTVWEVFGVSRWGAMIPIFIGAATTLILSGQLAKRLFPEIDDIGKTASWVLLGCFPFMIYSSLIMFDTMLSAVILGIFIVWMDYSFKGGQWRVVSAGLLIGLGVLIKGPVIYLYIGLPLFLYPFWKGDHDSASLWKYYGAVLCAILISLFPIALWLVPLLLQSSDGFAHHLLWDQTAGRVSGDLHSAHSRPFLFYFLCLPVLFLPWALFPQCWKTLKVVNLKTPSFAFLASATIPAFIAFSLISGKQPHYLLPLLPYIAIFLAAHFFTLNTNFIKSVSLGSVVLTITFLLIGSQTFFYKYDLMPMAEYYKKYQESEWAFVRKYQGELGFLARIDKPIDSLNGLNDLPAWFAKNPDARAFVRYNKNDKTDSYDIVFSRPYRRKTMGVLRLKNSRANVKTPLSDLHDQKK